MAFTITLYLAGTRLLNTKIPSGPETVARTAPVVRVLTSICAPGTAALLESVMVPVIVPVVDWLKTQPHSSAMAQSTRAICFIGMTNLPRSKFSQLVFRSTVHTLRLPIEYDPKYTILYNVAASRSAGGDLHRR